MRKLGNHPRVFVPKERPYREFESEICTYHLRHKEVLDRVRRSGRVAGGRGAARHNRAGQD